MSQYNNANLERIDLQCTGPLAEMARAWRNERNQTQDFLPRPLKEGDVVLVHDGGREVARRYSKLVMRLESVICRVVRVPIPAEEKSITGPPLEPDTAIWVKQLLDETKALRERVYRLERKAGQ